MVQRILSRKNHSRALVLGIGMGLLCGVANLGGADSPKTQTVENQWAAGIVSLPLLKAAEESKSTGRSLSSTASRLPGRKAGDGVAVEIVFDTGSSKNLRRYSIPGLSIYYVSEEFDRAYATVSSADAILTLAKLPGVKMIRPELGMMTNFAGVAESEAIRAMRTDTARLAYKIQGREIDGRTQKVGVLSDSVASTDGVRDENTSPAIGLPGILTGARNQDSGDLPPALDILLEPNEPGLTDEGAGMLELIYDIAPASNLAFHTAYGGEAVFADGIRRLRQEAGCTVIVDDVIYFFEPMYQDGIIAQQAAASVAAGVPYFSSAGNSTNFGFRFNFNDFNPSIDDLKPIPSGDDLHVWDQTGTRWLAITYPPGAPITIILQWNQPFESVPGSKGSQIDLDMHLYETPSMANAPLFTSNDIQGVTGAGAGDALEFIQLVNFSSTPGTLYLAVEHYDGNQDVIPQDNKTPLECRIVFFGGPLLIESINSDTNDYGGPTIYGHNMADGAVAVGAIPWFDTPEFNVLFPPTAAIDPENFTSLGGELTVYFDAAGDLNPRTTSEPDIAAVDGNGTTFFGAPLDLAGYQGEPDDDINFFGTSAAAPNAAAVAALMLDMDPTLTPAKILQIMQDTATDVTGRRANIGYDDTTGAGLIDAVGCLDTIADLLEIEPVIPPSPTPVPLNRQAYLFDNDSGGWIYQTIPQAFTEPVGDYRENALAISTTDNLFNFGFFLSPTHKIGAWERVGDVPLSGDNGDTTLFRATYSVRSDQPLAAITQVPVIRLRQGTENFEQSDLTIVESATTAGVSPGRTAKSYRLFFQLPPTQERFNLYFDVNNFGGGDAFEATLFVDRVTLDAIPTSSLADRRTVKSWNFSNNARGWNPPTPQAALATPDSGVESRGLRLGPATAGDDLAYFGFWGSPDNFEDPDVAAQAVKLSNGRLYRATWTVGTDAPEGRLDELPAFRLRVNDQTFNYGAYTNIESISRVSNLPSPFAPKAYRLYFEGRPEINDSLLIFSFDYLLIPGTGNAADLKVYLESLVVESFAPPF